LSHDKQFIAKTIDGDEYRELSRILRDYHQVITQLSFCLLSAFICNYEKLFMSSFVLYLFNCQ